MNDLDAIVLGAGPAGCAAAIVLARTGHRVAMVRPARTPAGALAESVPPSARRLLAELGLLAAVEAAGFEPNLGNVSWWAGEAARREDFEGGPAGFHTDRVSLERVLEAAAESIGVAVLRGTTARRAEENDGGWEIACEADDGASVPLAARWVVDATGRTGFLARSVRRPDRSTTTLALVRRYRRPGGWGEEARGRTLLESHTDGWAWSIPLDEEVRCVTAMVDQRGAGVEGVDAAEMLDAELAKLAHLGEGLRGAEPEGEAWACPASLHTSERFARPGLLLAGDAASTIDPLSSYGVKKALASGWLAGIAAHTALADPSMTAVAVDHFDAREREVWAHFRAHSAAYFESCAEAHGGEFWSARAEAARRAAPAPAPATATPAGPADDPDPTAHEDVPRALVEAAFEQLKRRDHLRCRVSDGVERVEAAAIRGDLVVMTEHLRTSRLDRPIRWAHNVDLDVVADLAPGHTEVSELWTAYNAASPPVPLPDFLTGLSTAFAAGILEHLEG